MNKYYKSVYDIDAVVRYGGKLRAIEIKRKYPNPPDKFGIDNGAKLFLEYLSEFIDTFHIILTSACWDKYKSPFVMFDDEAVGSNTVWMGARINKEFLGSSQENRIVAARESDKNDEPKLTPMFSVGDFSLLGYLGRPIEEERLSRFFDDTLEKIPSDFLEKMMLQVKGSK